MSQTPAPKPAQHAFSDTIPAAARKTYAEAMGHSQAGRLREALELYEDLLRRHPDFAQALHQRGAIAFSAGNRATGFADIERAHALCPDDPIMLADYASILWQQNRRDEAVAQAERCLELAPDYAPALNNLAVMYAFRREPAKAAPLYKRALEHAPNNPDTLNNYGAALEELRRHEAALETLYKALGFAPNYAPAHANVAKTLFSMERFDSALYHADKAIELHPRMRDAYDVKGQILMALGRRDDALALFRSMLSLFSDQGAILQRMANAKRYSADDPDAAFLEERASHLLGDTNAKTGTGVRFALGKLYDDLGRYDEAFEAYAKANDAVAEAHPYDEATDRRRHEGNYELYTEDFVAYMSENPPGYHTEGGVGPIFIVGMPRSGTTLTESMIASHSAVHPGGEMRLMPMLLSQNRFEEHEDGTLVDGVPRIDLTKFKKLGQDYWALAQKEAGRMAWVTDKMPANYMNVGLIFAMLPAAKVIHCRRHPLDTCLSNYMQSFGELQPFSAKLDWLARRYRLYTELMAFWETRFPGRVLTLNYEDTIADPKAQMERALAHIGLPWEDAVLEPHKLRRGVRTASVAQVREPIYDRSIGRWKHYRAHLGPLIEGLEALARTEE